MNKRIRKKKERQLNKALCERYPFLIPRNRWTDRIVWDSKDNWTYCTPYTYTELDSFPKGWFKAFGHEMLEEIRDDCIKNDFLYDMRIVEIKEKYGGLRFYIGSIPMDSKLFEIINKYEEMSYEYCMLCGRPAETSNEGYWVETLCPDCKQRMKERKEAALKRLIVASGRNYESKR